jgi:adenylosuccinate lyase
VIKKHAIAVALRMRETGRGENDLLDRLAADPRLGVTRAELDAALADPIELAGTAGRQVAALAAQIEVIAKAHPEAAGYRPGLVL